MNRNQVITIQKVVLKTATYGSSQHLRVLRVSSVNSFALARTSAVLHTFVVHSVLVKSLQTFFSPKMLSVCPNTFDLVWRRQSH